MLGQDDLEGPPPVIGPRLSLAIKLLMAIQAIVFIGAFILAVMGWVEPAQ